MVHKDCDIEYAEQITAEQKVSERSNGKIAQKWVPKTAHADNHYLDCEVYAAAAADILEVWSLFSQNKSKLSKKEDQKPRQESPPEENWIQQNEDWI